MKIHIAFLASILFSISMTAQKTNSKFEIGTGALIGEKYFGGAAVFLKTNNANHLNYKARIDFRLINEEENFNRLNYVITHLGLEKNYNLSFLNLQVGTDLSYSYYERRELQNLINTNNGHSIDFSPVIGISIKVRDEIKIGLEVSPRISYWLNDNYLFDKGFSFQGIHSGLIYITYTHTQKNKSQY